MQSTLDDALRLLKLKPIEYEDPGVMQEYPLVDTASNMVLMGTVTRRALEQFVKGCGGPDSVTPVVDHPTTPRPPATDAEVTGRGFL